MKAEKITNPPSTRGKSSAGSKGKTSSKRATTKPVEVSPREQAKVLAALRETLFDITTGMPLPDLLQAMVERAAKLLQAHGGGMYLNEPGERRVRCVVSYKTFQDYRGTLLGYDEGAAGRVAKTGKPLMIADYSVWSGRAAVFEKDRPFRAVICAPMKWQGRVTGVFTVMRDKKFTRKDLALLTLFTDHAVVAVENARLYESVEQELAERKSAKQSLKSSEDRFRQLWEATIEGIAIHENGIIKEVNPALLRLFGYSRAETIGKSLLDFAPPEARDEIQKRFMARDEQPYETFFIRPDGTRLTLEITGRNARYQGRASRIVSVRDITEHKQAEAEQNRRLRELSILYENGLALGRLRDPKQISEHIIKALSEKLSWHHSTVRLRRGDSDELDLIAFHQSGLKESERGRVKERFDTLVHKMGQGLSGLAMQKGKVIRTGNVKKYPQYVDTYPGIQSGLYVPLKIAERVIGCICVESEEADAFSDQDERLLSTLAAQAAISFENAHLYQDVQQDLLERKRMDQALRESESRHRDLLERLPLVVYTAEVGIAGAWHYVSPNIQDLLGFTEDEWRADPGLWYRQVHPEDRDKHQALEDRALISRSPFENEYRIFTKDGQLIWVRDSGIILPSNEDKGFIVRGVLTEVTDRVSAEQALRESEARYHAIIEQAAEGMVIYDLNTLHVIEANPAYGHLLGYTVEEMSRITIHDIVAHPREEIDRYIDRIRTEKQVWLGERQHRRKDGALVDVEVSSNLITMRGRDALLIVVRDITERKRSEKIQQSVYEIARASVTTRSLDELYASIHTVLQGLLPTPNFYIAVYDHEKDLLSFPYYIDSFDVAPPPQKPGRGMTEYIMRTRQPLLATQGIWEEPEWQGEIELVGTAPEEWLGVPLIAQDRAIGAMVVQTYDKKVHFGEQDMQVMMYVSTQVANAIERKRAEEALQRSEAFARSIVENEPECVKIVGAGGVMQYMNPAGLAMIEVDDFESVRGKSIYPIVVPEHRAAFQELTERVLRGEQRTLEFEVIGRRGTRRWLDTQAVPLFNEQGEVESLLGITRDITKRKQAEALQEAVYRITKAAETTASISDLFPQIHEIISSVMPAENFFITLYDETHNLLEFPYFHDALDEPFLDKIEPGMGLTAYVLRTGKSLLCTQAVHDDLEQRGEVKLLGVPSRIWLGVPLIVEGRSIGVMVVQHYTDPDAYGEREQHILEFVSSQIATTIQRKQSEQALRESEERYRTLFKGMLDGVYRSTHDGRFLDVNQAMVRLFGYDSREEMLQVDIKKELYFAPEERESLFLDTGQEKVDVFRMKRKDGSEIWVEDHGQYVHDERGDVVYHEGILRDVTERIQAEYEISRLLQESQQRLRHVEALRSIDLAIGSSMDLRTTLNILLSYVKSLLAVDAADILLFNRNSQSFEFAASNGFRSRVSDAAFQAMGRSFASRVALERRVTQFRDPPEAQANRELSALWKAEGFVTYTGVPLIAKGDLKGVLEIHHRSIFHPETAWMDLVQNFSTQAAIAVENAQLFNDLQNTNFELSLAYDATIEGWSKALELRGNEAPGHFQRVTELTLTLARAMGMRDAELIHVRRGALLHDIGKMAIPDSILRKTGPLNEQEWELMRKHPIQARELLTPVAYLRPALDIPCYHHEKWDGSGYPNGLKGEAIPMAARVFAVADVYDVSTNDHFYRKGLSREKAVEYIKSESGKHFDPSVVGAFLQLLSKGELNL